MAQTRRHTMVGILIAGFLILTLVTSPGCSFLVKHAAGTVVKKVAKGGYEHLKESREKNARAKKARSRPLPNRVDEHSD